VSSLFISYRRDDSPDTVKLLYEHLRHRLPRWEIFYDHESIPLGAAFPEHLRMKVTSATAVLVIIGPKWLDLLHQRQGMGMDHVREEVRLALESGGSVIPVLVGRALLPASADLGDFPDLAPLLARNGQPVRPDPDFDSDLEAILEHLERLGASETVGATVAGKYTLTAELGQGGMGIVFRAEQKQPVKRTVAVKLIKPGMDSREVLARFDAERQALALMDHPNIARVLDAGMAASRRPFFVMEYIQGVPITDYCDANKLTPQQRLELFIPVCHAVQHAHQKGIIHRDLKPSNVLVEVIDGKPVPVVIDFGVAKALGQKLTDQTLATALDTRVGTLEYSAPEQAAGRSFDIDTRSDIYSLGILLYELLTGAPPFTRHELHKEGEEEMRRVIRDVAPTRPSKKLSSSGQLAAIAARRRLEAKKLTRLVKGELDWIIMKCLEKEQSRRYETANQLAQDLEHFLRDEPVSAGPPSARYRLGKFLRRHKGPVIAAAVVLFALVAGTIGTTIGLVRAELARQALLQKQRELRHQLAVNYLESGANDCVNHEPGLGLSSLLAAYEAAEPDDSLRRSIRLLMAGWEPGLATRFLSEENLEAVGFQPGGSLVMTAGRDGKAHFWNKNTRMPSGRPVTPGSKVWSAAFCPKGDLLATGDDEGGAVLWDVATRKMVGQRMLHPKPGRVRTLAFSPDGKILATGCGDSLLRLSDIIPQKPMGEARLWDVATQKLIGQPLPHGQEVLCVAFSPDGSTLATGCDDTYLRFWDVKTQKMIGEPIKHAKGVWTVSYSPDGKYFFTGDWGSKRGGIGRLYDAHTHKLIHDRIRHKKGIIASVFTSDSQQIFTGSRDATAQFWDVKEGIRVGQDFASLRSIPSVALTPWTKHKGGRMTPHADEFMTCSRDNVARLFRDSDPQPIGQPFIHPKAVTALAVSPDGKRLATACKDGIARIWDLATGKRIGKDMQHDGPVNALAFSSDGSLLVTGGEDKTIRQWHAATGELAADPIPYRAAITALALSPDRRWVLVGGRADHAAQCIDLTTGHPIQEPLRHDEAVRAVALADEGKLLITGSEDSSIRLWDRDKHVPAGKTMHQRDKILSLAVDAAGKLLASGGADNTVRLWDLTTQRELQEMKGHEHDVYAVALSADGSLVLSGGGPDDRTSRLWDAATGKQVAEAIKYESAVLAVAFLPDGKRYLVARESGKVDLWATPQPVPDEPRRIAAWIRSRTVWTREGAHQRRLTAAEWTENIHTLAELGGPFQTAGNGTPAGKD
jgi:WD40 repeat protein/serine/threonine protein kinase